MNPRIVISAGATIEASYAASELRAAIAEYQGITPDIVYDSEAAADGDIYVGVTAYSQSIPAGDAYVIRSEGKRVYISAGSAYGFEAAIKAAKGVLDTYGCLTEDMELSGDGSTLRTCGLAQEGQVRFLTYNVYGWNNSAHNTTATLRQPYQLSLLSSYDADILAFQEFSNNNEKKGVVRYRSEEFLAGLRALGYAEIGNGELLNSDGGNYTPLFYKTGTLSVIDSGYLLFSGYNDVNSKSVTWAVFEDGSGKRFIAMSTHFMWNDNTGAFVPRTDDMTDDEYKDIVDEAANTLRIQNAEELLGLLEEIKAKHGELPVIMGGDLNTSYSRARHDPLTSLEQGGLIWAQGDANAVNSVNGHGSYAMWDSEAQVFRDCPSHSSRDGSYSIDHIWYSGLSIERFATVTDRYACFSSDHSPKIVDFSIN